MRDTEAVVTGTAKKWATARPRGPHDSFALRSPSTTPRAGSMRPPFLTSSKTTPAGNRQYLLVLTGHIHLTGYLDAGLVNKPIPANLVGTGGNPIKPVISDPNPNASASATVTRTRILVRTRAVAVHKSSSIRARLCVVVGIFLPFILLLFGQHEFRTCRPMGSPPAFS